MHIYIINDLLSSPNMEEHSKSHDLPEVIIFLGSKRSTISSQICILEAQKTFENVTFVEIILISSCFYLFNAWVT